MVRSKKYIDIYPTLVEEYKRGKSLSKIAKEFGVDRGTLSNNLKKDGIEVCNKQNRVRVKEDNFSVIDSEEKAYWLGFLYADGYVSLGKNVIELSLQARDLEHIKKFHAFMESENSIYYNKSNNSYRSAFASEKTKNDLIKLGCFPQKSLKLSFPSEEQVPLKFIKDFTRGYIDGDGSIGLKKNGVYRLSILGTREFLEVLVDKMDYRKLSISKVGNIYCIEWAGAYTEGYLIELYQDATIYLNRKKQLLNAVLDRKA